MDLPFINRDGIRGDMETYVFYITPKRKLIITSHIKTNYHWLALVKRLIIPTVLDMSVQQETPVARIYTGKSGIMTYQQKLIRVLLLLYP